MTQEAPTWEQTEASTVLSIGEGLIVDPTSAQRMIAIGADFPSTSPSVQHSYATEDGGQTWNELPPPPHSVDLSGGFADAGGMLYLSLEGHFLRSSDWGKTWTDTGQLPEPDSLPTTLGSITPGLLYLPGRGQFWTSTDAGSHWSSQSVTAESSPVLALDRSTLLAFDPSGLSLSKDAGKSWRVNLRVGAPGALIESPLAPNLIWSLSTAYQAERNERRVRRPSRRSDDGGNTWSAVPDISPYLAFDGADANVIYDGLTVTTQRRSDDGGRRWTPLTGSPFSTAAASCVSGASCLYFLNQSWQDATRDFSCQLARSNDGGRTQSQPWEVPLLICQTGVLAVAPDSSDHLLAGCGNSVCESHDGGQHFDTHVIDANPHRFVDKLTFLPSGVALLATRNVTEPGFEASAVFLRSIDTGRTWVEMKGLELLPTAHFFASYAKPGVVFAVDPLGRHTVRSDDDGSTWRQASPPSDDSTASRYDDPAALIVFEIVDHAGGGFLASTNQGLVHFE